MNASAEILSCGMLAVVLAFVVLALVFLLAIEIGFRFGTTGTPSTEVAEPERVTATFVMSLLSLILAFSLNLSQTHYHERSAMILEEAQSIRATRRTLEDLPTELSKQALVQLDAYVQSKREYNNLLNKAASPADAFEKGRRILHEIRRICRSDAASQEADLQRLTMERLTHLGEVGLERHVLVTSPHGDVLIRFLFIVSLLACVLVGHAHRVIGKRVWWAYAVFSTVVSGTLVLIFDYDSPRLGLIRVDASDVLYDE